jgi:hypothetical protein
VSLLRYAEHGTPPARAGSLPPGRAPASSIAQGHTVTSIAAGRRSPGRSSRRRERGQVATDPAGTHGASPQLELPPGAGPARRLARPQARRDPPGAARSERVARLTGRPCPPARATVHLLAATAICACPDAHIRPFPFPLPPASADRPAWSGEEQARDRLPLHSRLEQAPDHAARLIELGQVALTDTSSG